MASPLVGVALLAAGAGALNQVQERELDARMPRTRCRPLPAAQIGPRAALACAAALLLAGLALLARAGAPAALLGLGATLWYNVLYTPLKRRSALAPVAGALVGAAPPAIGWVSAGGTLADPRLASLCGLLLLWQLPHVALLALAHNDEHAAAGLPVPVGAAARRRLALAARLGVLGCAAGGLLLPLAVAPAERLVLAAAALALAASARGVGAAEAAACRRALRAVNVYLVLVLLLAVLAGVHAARTWA
jgi:protoheme IX farnesyltransferase